MTEQKEGVAQPPYPREPNVHSGGEQEPGGGERPIPPYDDRKTSGPGEQDKEPLVAERDVTSEPREVSQAEREGVSDTDTTAASPHGVGESTSTSGNEPPLGQSEASRRSDRLDTGVSREDNVDSESPAMHSGDQGS